jgi:hypothetical protein
MMKLALTVYELEQAPNVTVFPFVSQAMGVSFSTGPGGYDHLIATVPMSSGDAFIYYDMFPGRKVVLSDGAFKAFEGRIERTALVDVGLRIDAFGFQRALHDVLYTGIWSTQRYDTWRIIDENEQAAWTPAKYYTDFNGRLYISLRAGESYVQGTDAGGVVWHMPNLGDNNPVEIEYTCDFNLPAGWVAALDTYDEGYTNANQDADLTSDGTGTYTKTLTASRELVSFTIFNSSGTDPYTNTGETDDYYLEIIDLRIRGTANDSVYADEIVKALVAYVNGINSGQLSAVTGLVWSPNIDMPELVYEDDVPARIISDLSAMGDDSSPVDLWEWAVWEDQRLQFWDVGTYGLDWYADVDSLNVSQDLDTMNNSVYGIYRGTRGRIARTAHDVDTASQTKNGIVRHAAVDSGGTDLSLTNTMVDARLADNKDMSSRGTITIPRVFNSSGGLLPLYHVRAGDTMNIRNIPPSLGSGVDKLRTFRISRTQYDAETDTLMVTPEFDAPSLEAMVAQSTAFDFPRRFTRRRR